ncbi:hypothetical protein [Hymenobacter sp. YC55]|uniref:hypothetical protein n=1 Tax=Hymenobacter sp. YC55 TaxID=3034019 RepID=UPI0023F93167|nr:hypothetical protein [Hymenobacter sp. YC55]MDF7815166.1 hypothetical protein [Hymenobacter sp. YC55]
MTIPWQLDTSAPNIEWLIANFTKSCLGHFINGHAFTTMSSTLPSPQLILGFETFFGRSEPTERLSLLQSLPKREIITELAGLNYRLKPKDSIEYSSSYAQQVEELKRFVPFWGLFLPYKALFDAHTAKTKDPVIFTRATCLFAIEEILKSDLADVEPNFVMDRQEVWDAIFKYLLCVNTVISDIKNPDEENTTFESVNAKLLALNELLIPIDPIYFPYRGYKLLEYLHDSPEYKDELTAYLASTYGRTYEELVHAVMSLYLANKQPDNQFDFMYFTDPAKGSTILPALAKVFSNPDTIKLVSLRKYPFASNGEGVYCLIDNAFLLEKIYSQFVHDFWFDWLKAISHEGKSKFNIASYRGKIGYFVEHYLHYWMTYMFAKKASYRMLTFDELKFQKGKNQIELADLYIRDGNRILVGQVKSGSIYDQEKFGGDIEALYKGDREKFFANFGVHQLVSSIQEINENMKALDKGFPKGHSYEVYPCIVVNDKVFQTPIMANVFNDRFQEQLQKITLPSRVKIHQLTLLHVSDIERMSVAVNKRPKLVWELLKFNTRDPHFIPPFYNTLNIKLVGREYAQEVREMYYDLIHRFSHSTSA